MSQRARRSAVPGDKRARRWPRQLAPASEQALHPLAPGAILHRAALAPEPLRPAEGEFEVDGQPQARRAPLTFRSNVLGEGFSFSLEPLGTRQSHV